MTALKAHEVERFVARPDVAEGVFLVYGPDAGLVREIGHKLTRRFAGDDAGSMNLVTLEGSELDADPGRLAAEARGPVELLVIDDGNHVAHNRPYRYRPQSADWMAERLGAVPPVPATAAPEPAPTVPAAP